MVTVAESATSSTSLERDARRATVGHGAVSPGEIALGVIIGRTSEAFNFFTYGIASVLVFPAVVFPFASHLVGTLYAFAVFSLSFLSRPVGSIVFMAIDRRHGRGTKLTIALILLGGSTASIAFLPGYTEIGYLSILGLILFRLGQGFASRRRLGRPRLAARTQRAPGSPRLLRDDSATRGAARLCGGGRPLRVFHPQPFGGGFSKLGMALRVLCGLRHQCRRALRAASASSPPRSSRNSTTDASSCPSRSSPCSGITGRPCSSGPSSPCRATPSITSSRSTRFRTSISIRTSRSATSCSFNASEPLFRL